MDLDLDAYNKELANQGLELGILFNPDLHPRDFLGKFRQEIATMHRGQSRELGNIRVEKAGSGKYHVHGPDGTLAKHTDPKAAAMEAAHLSAQSTKRGSLGGKKSFPSYHHALAAARAGEIKSFDKNRFKVALETAIVKAEASEPVKELVDQILEKDPEEIITLFDALHESMVTATEIAPEYAKAIADSAAPHMHTIANIASMVPHITSGLFDQREPDRLDEE